MRDFKRLQQEPPTGISAAPEENNILKWNAVIFGPDDTAWEDGTFKLSLEFTEEYPNKAPKVKFLSTMFHPNVYADGSICLDILQNQWSPIYDIAAILTSIQSLLSDPNPNSPANNEAARMFEENKREYLRRVKQIVETSWEEDGGADVEPAPTIDGPPQQKPQQSVGSASPPAQLQAPQSPSQQQQQQTPLSPQQQQPQSPLPPQLSSTTPMSPQRQQSASSSSQHQQQSAVEANAVAATSSSSQHDASLAAAAEHGVVNKPASPSQ